MKCIWYITIISIVALIGLGATFFLIKNNVIAEQTANQDTIVTQITADLKEQGVPIKSVQITNDKTWDPPIIIEYSLLSSSDNDKGTPDDTINWNLIGHDVNLAQKNGLQVGAIGTVIINTRGSIIFKDLRRSTKIGDISTPPEPVTKLDDDTAKTLIQNSLSQYASYLNVKVSPTKDGLHNCVFDLKSSNVSTANGMIINFMNDARFTINQLNLEKGAQIGYYRINLTSESGTTLLKYINDVQLGRESWWQDDYLTNDWLPHPG